LGGSFEHEGKIWKVGGHPWADMTTFSFHPVKTMTTGEGGMLVTNNDTYAAKARALRSHGMTRTPVEFSGLGTPSLCEQGPWYYEMQNLGYNYRITDIQCALGLSQLKQLDEFTKRRREIVRVYNAAFSGIDGINVPKLKANTNLEHTSWHLYTLQIDFKFFGASRTELMEALKRCGIGTQVLYIPVHLQPWYRANYGYGFGKCPIAENFYSEALSLPLYPGLSSDQITHVVKSFIRVLSTFRKAS